MGALNIGRVVLNTPELRTKARVSSDLMFKEVVFVYPVSQTRESLGTQKDTWATIAQPVSASVQFSGLQSQLTDPTTKPAKYAKVYTRSRHAIKWHDRVKVRGILCLVEAIEDKFENRSGDYQFSEARVRFLEQEGSLSGTPATVSG